MKSQRLGSIAGETLQQQMFSTTRDSENPFLLTTDRNGNRELKETDGFSSVEEFQMGQTAIQWAKENNLAAGFYTQTFNQHGPREDQTNTAESQRQNMML